MNEELNSDPSVANFVEDVDKEIIEESPQDAWHHPHRLDVVAVEVGEKGGEQVTHEIRSWTVGSGDDFAVAGVELDRCVRTMRLGELCTVKKKGSEHAPVRLRLRALERQEDLLGDRGVLRTTVRDGKEWQTPQAGTELRVRFAWRAVPANSKDDDTSKSAEKQGIEIILGGSDDSWIETATCNQLGDLCRDLLHHFKDTVVVRWDIKQADKAVNGPVLCIARGIEILASKDNGMTIADAKTAVETALLSGASEITQHRREPREVLIRFEEGSCICSAEDWIPGVPGLRVLSDLRKGQRCLVRIAPEHRCGLVNLGIPPDADLEYDVELMQIMTLEDVSLDKKKGMMKKTTREGTGYERPVEGAQVTIKLEARDDTSGAVILEEKEVSFASASGKFCPAVDETVLVMKKGEACEVRCIDVAACADTELGLPSTEGTVTVISIEMIDFDKIDLYGSEEPARVAHCASRKEVGTKLFQAGNWRRALKRYQHVTTTLAYLDHWKDEASKSEAVSLRRQCHLNAGLCCLKLEAWREAEKACSLVLGEDVGNVKALFRKGQALKELAEYRDAEQCFKKVLEADKENKEAARMLVKVRQLLKSEVDKQKEMFSRMVRSSADNNPSPDTSVTTEKAKGLKQEDKVDIPQEASSSSYLLWGLVPLVACSVLGAVWLRRMRRS